MKSQPETSPLRAQILDAARELFLEEGFHQVSMRKLAKKIGYSPTTIYLYFRNKDEIFQHLSDEVLESYCQALKNIRNDTDSPVERLVIASETLLDKARSNPEAYRLSSMLPCLAWNSDSQEVPTGKNINCLHEFFGETVRDCLQLSTGGNVTPENVELNLQMLWALIHGMLTTEIDCPGYPWSPIAARKERLRAVISSIFSPAE